MMWSTDRPIWSPEVQAKVDAHVKRVVDSAPPLTPEQRDRLALLLRPKPDETHIEIAPMGGAALDEMMEGE